MVVVVLGGALSGDNDESVLSTALSLPAETVAGTGLTGLVSDEVTNECFLGGGGGGCAVGGDASNSSTGDLALAATVALTYDSYCCSAGDSFCWKGWGLLKSRDDLGDLLPAMQESVNAK